MKTSSYAKHFHELHASIWHLACDIHFILAAISAALIVF